MNPKNLIYTIIALIVVIGFFFFLSNRGKDIANFPNSRTDIVMFGDSLVAGNGSTEGNSLPEQLGRSINTSVLNLGIPGNTTIDGLDRTSEIPQDARLVIINLGGNDALKRVPEEITLQNMRNMIAQVQQNGSIAMIISVRSGLLVGTFDKEYQKIARETGALYMPNLLKGLFGNSTYMADAIHPNDIGYSIIAERITEVIEDYL